MVGSGIKHPGSATLVAEPHRFCMDPDSTILKIRVTELIHLPLFPTVRNFCRKKQKWPQRNLSGRENPQPNLIQNSLNNGIKGAELFELNFSLKILGQFSELDLEIS
jgi:hypothetical protein